MTRIITALYETPAEAERVRAALQAAGLGHDVDVHDQGADHATDKQGLGGWLSHRFGGHDDSRLYAEGLRRGHVLLTAKVDDLNETRAAEIADSEPPVDLTVAERTWREQGWNPWPPEAGLAHRHPAEIALAGTGLSAAPFAPLRGSGIRAYTL